MVKKIIVQYYKNLCIGQSSCISIAPDHFELVNQKAKLINSNELDENISYLEINDEETIVKNLTDAANSCPVNAIRIIDKDNGEDIIGINVEEEKARVVMAEYDDNKDFVLDQSGYFLIRIDKENKNIEVGFCNQKNKVILKVIGKKPIDIYTTIINKENLSIRKDHAAYLGRELQKAYIALKNDLKYVQDDELEL